MDNRIVTTVRLPAELSGWLSVYAKRRDVSKTVVIEAALREFREACEGGVPELGQATVDNQAASPAGASERPSHTGHHASAAGAVPARVAPRPSSARAPRAAPPPDYMLERQERLRKQMGWDKS
jgi:hypothetical protein